ncbi:MAG: hypothetical protein HZB56_05535 [Deltaproteobacteria bacterium]|nr:hypothetical protein [Deltaproteobacteria bacterium]
MSPLPLLLALAMAADPVAELLATLDGLRAGTPVRAQISYRFELVNGEGEEAIRDEGAVSAEASEGPEGVTVRWSPELVERAREEARRRSVDPEARTPTRRGMTELDAMAVARRLDAGRELRHTLAQAELVEDRPDALDGAPARLLVLRIPPRLGKQERRYVKEAETTARLWLGTDGVPLAAELHTRARGRIFLVIGFELEDRDRLRFARLEDRLVAVRHERDHRAQGAGEHQTHRATTAVEPMLLR